MARTESSGSFWINDSKQLFSQLLITELKNLLGINSKRVSFKLLDRSFFFSALRSGIFRNLLFSRQVFSSRTQVSMHKGCASRNEATWQQFDAKCGCNFRGLLLSMWTHHSEMFEGTRFWAEVNYLSFRLKSFWELITKSPWRWWVRGSKE